MDLKKQMAKKKQKNAFVEEGGGIFRFFAIGHISKDRKILANRIKKPAPGRQNGKRNRRLSVSAFRLRWRQGFIFWGARPFFKKPEKPSEPIKNHLAAGGFGALDSNFRRLVFVRPVLGGGNHLFGTKAICGFAKPVFLPEGENSRTIV